MTGRTPFSPRRMFTILGGLCTLCCLAGLLAFPSQSASSVRDGIKICLDVIVPCLFPFFVLSSLLVEMGCATYFGLLLEPVMRPVFNLNGACASAVAMGFLGGYPVGARTAISLYRKGLCTREEAERMLSFCNNSGPAFVLGVVGVGIFSSNRAGILLFLAHTAASLTVGFLFRFYKRGSRPMDRGSRLPIPENISFSKAFIDSVSSSVRSMLGICAFVVFFTVAIKMLFLCGFISAMSEVLCFFLSPFGLTAESAGHLLTGLIELTSGLWGLRGSSSTLTAQLSMAAFMLGWAGLSVHCQVLSFIEQSGLKSRTYMIGKTLHALISSLYVWLMAGVWGLEEPAAETMAEQIKALVRMDFANILGISLTVALIGWIFFVGLAWAAVSRRIRIRIV